MGKIRETGKERRGKRRTTRVNKIRDGREERKLKW